MVCRTPARKLGRLDGAGFPCLRLHLRSSQQSLAKLFGNNEQSVANRAKRGRVALWADKHIVRQYRDGHERLNAFWSVTLYDGRTQLLIANPINRYLINSPMLPNLKNDPDGALRLYIQKDSPGKARASNGLSAPNGPIYLVMRWYWPKETPPSILPPGSGTWQPPAVKRVD
jgi:hypothetical protein